MPYIKQEDRNRLELTGAPETPGELNFAFTCLAIQYWDSRKNYQTINDIIGALEGAKLEFYARVGRVYEEQKIKENGDVYRV
jgi:hypothetical protein